jgi:hypothetical protein
VPLMPSLSDVFARQKLEDIQCKTIRRG